MLTYMLKRIWARPLATMVAKTVSNVISGSQ
jgi:hypothetical protein